MVRIETWKNINNEEQKFLHYSCYQLPSEEEQTKFKEWITESFGTNEGECITFYGDGDVFIRNYPLAVKCGNDFWIGKGYGTFVIYQNSTFLRRYSFVRDNNSDNSDNTDTSKNKKGFKFDLSKIDIEVDESFKKNLHKLETIIQNYLDEIPKDSKVNNVYKLVSYEKEIADILYNDFSTDEEAFVNKQMPKLFFNLDNGASQALIDFDWHTFTAIGDTSDAEYLCNAAYNWLTEVQQKIINKEENYTAGTYQTVISTNHKDLLIIMPVEEQEVDNIDEATVFLIAPKAVGIGNEYR